jgi:hypothetical protein
MKSVMPMVGWIAVGLALLMSFGIDLANVARGGPVFEKIRQG